jgi:hypothetical protein
VRGSSSVADVSLMFEDKKAVPTCVQRDLLCEMLLGRAEQLCLPRVCMLCKQVAAAGARSGGQLCV